MKEDSHIVIMDMLDRYGISVSQMTTDMFHLSQALSGPFLIHDLSPGSGGKIPSGIKKKSPPTEVSIK
jgi:hypothetical protein